MPRQRRLDIPGVIHHVMARGIERRRIFLDEEDRDAFLERLSRCLEITKCRCYAWVLMSNHFHLLIRTGGTSLSDLLRRLLTGYAVYFNRKYRRSGHLFQNRYMSILCEEESYFMELVRYIHLNPVRAKLVKTLSQLDKYPWTGHSVIMGNQEREWEETGEVLIRFGEKKRVARAKYREFIREGMGEGYRDELMGGGLKRSAGGWEGIRELMRQEIHWRGDERILGDGDFVDDILKASGEALERREVLKRKGWSLDKLIRHACDLMNVEPEEIVKKGRDNKLSRAKGLITYWGKTELGISGGKLSLALKISQPAVCKLFKRGEEYAKETGIKLLS